MSEIHDRGRFFEDYKVGDVFRNLIGRTVTEADNTWFTLITMNTNQTHFNSHYAASSEFKKPLLNSGLTVAIILGLSVVQLSQQGIANLGWTDIVLTHPVFAGDTLYAESKILKLRESRSRPHAGIVTALTRGLNQDGKVCISWTRSVMVLKRSAAQAAGTFPVAETPIEAI